MTSEGAVEMVKRGYTEETRCLDFTVGFYSDLEGVHDAVRFIGQYNEFDAQRVSAALENLTEYMPAYGSRVRVGREGSPVLYITIDGEQDFPAVHAILEAAHADEIDLTGNVVRAWWD